ncbi:HAD-IC family P-type ATPase [Candidatus Woesearchaeota archaeon]|nr:HAD-IC family P-type ATPase [Candidatus Woesearchaeota archaeon]
MRAFNVGEVLKGLETDSGGLSSEEAKGRLTKYGFNELRGEKRVSPLKIFLSQFKDPLIVILFVATLVSVYINEVADAFIIAAIIVLNAVVGFFQEFKAERAFELLKKMSVPHCIVFRDRKEEVIESRFLVSGDIIILGAGNKAPADALLIESMSLEVDESALTGESIPVQKSIAEVDEGTALSERSNMIFSGTTITRGTGKAVVVSTGMNTEFGKIAKLVQTIETATTPLQKKLQGLGKWLGAVILFICLIIFGLGILTGKFNFFELFMTVLSLAVAAIPEGLPAVVTICLALGLRRMLNRKALIRRLKAVETLGSITVICTDKTGTLTKNEMTAIQLFVNNQYIDVSGSGYETSGEFKINNKAIDPKRVKLLLEIAASCNDSTLEIGDPTERALVVLAKKGFVEKDEARIGGIPFDSDKKYMATFHKNGLAYFKGAPEKILEMCGYIQINSSKRRITSKEKSAILNESGEMAASALRVLACAYSHDKKLRDLTFVGLVGMIDPPRDEAQESIALCEKAGIRAVMITGDHLVTAKAIANRIGLKGDAINGDEIDKLSMPEMQELVKKVTIFARASSTHKVRILSALQKNEEIVAMTGDGINDAPALKKANVGVAMNIKGTDVSREAADMTLLDDNFATIVSAIREGRTIYDNIKKFVKFLLAANLGEVLLILIAIIVSLPLPLLPIHILWINLVTDSLPALALSVEKSDPKIMERKPRPVNESIFHNIKFFLIVAGLLTAMSSLAAFLVYYWDGGDIVKARTIALTTIVVFELLLVFACRSKKLTLVELGLFSNRYLVGAVAVSFIAHLLIIYTPLSAFFKLASLGLNDWLIVLAFGASGLLFFEIKKFFFPNKELIVQPYARL